MLSAPAPPGRAGVVGSPIAHSLSPALHRAAYAALGLGSWTFEAAEVPAGQLRGYVEQLPPEWVGLAVTMPLKEEALALGSQVGAAARLAGAANTLVRRSTGWFADNTDVHGVVRALREAGLEAPRRATVLGGGATARSTVLALHEMGVRETTMLVRSDLRPQTRRLAEDLEMELHVAQLHATTVALDPAAVDVVVSTLPATADPCEVALLDGVDPPVLMDVVYTPWPSRFARAVERASAGRARVVRGTEMLLHQAVRQVELMTGQEGPVPQMRAALGAVGTGPA